MSSKKLTTKKTISKKEILIISTLSFLIFSLIGFELYLFNLSQSLPFVASIFFFGLVNINIILFFTLAYLIFKIIIKNLAQRKKGTTEMSLKGKLIASFVGFSFIPTALMFLIFVFYINTSFEKWFSSEMKEVLKSALEVNKSYVIESKKKNYHFAYLIAEKINSKPFHLEETKKLLSSVLKLYDLDALEFYDKDGKRRISIYKETLLFSELPELPLELKKNALLYGKESSLVQPFQEGNLVKVMIPLKNLNHLKKINNLPHINNNNRSKEPFHSNMSLNPLYGTLVVSSFVPFSLLSKIDNITTTYESVRDAHLLEIPLKSIYLIILILMTLVLLLCATWLGLSLAKGLTIPLELLGKATHKLTKGDYKTLDISSGSREIEQLVKDFNFMTEFLEKSQKDVKSAQTNLKTLLKELNQHTRYIEIILSQVSAGVISLDSKNIIKTINHYASKTLQIPIQESVDKKIEHVLSRPSFETLKKFIKQFDMSQLQQKEKEIQLQLKGRVIPLHVSLSALEDEQKVKLGKVLVFNDLTLTMSAQRAAAWKEVAERMAHEIKNPLTPIRLAAERLKNKFEEKVNNKSFNRCTSTIIDQVENLKNLVNEFNYYTRLPKLYLRLSSLNQVIDETLMLFSETYKSIQWIFKSDPELKPFYFDPYQIKRVITNLLSNSLTAVKEFSSPKIEIITQWVKEENKVIIQIIDNGIGIPHYLKDKVFDPYITTKTHGTGLGLSIAKRSIQDHNGKISIEGFFSRNEKRQKTKVIIDLPFLTTFENIKKDEPQKKSIPPEAKLKPLSVLSSPPHLTKRI